MPKGQKAKPWSDDELLILGSGMETREIKALLPERTMESIMSKRQIVFGKKYTLRHLAEPELSLLRELWAKHVPVEGIAAEINTRLGIKRSIGSIRQTVYKHRMHRDARKTILAKKFGYSALTLGNTVEEIKAVIEHEEQQRKALADNAHATKVEEILDQVEAHLQNGENRKTLFQAALMAGCTLQEIGTRLGISRERVRQIAHRERAKQFRPYKKKQKENLAAINSKPDASYVKYNFDSGRYDYGTMTKSGPKWIGSELNYMDALDRAAKLTTGEPG